MDRDFEKEVIERLIRIETKMGDSDRRINELEDKIKWIERTIIGALITGGIGIIYAILKLGLKI